MVDDRYGWSEMRSYESKESSRSKMTSSEFCVPRTQSTEPYSFSTVTTCFESPVARGPTALG